MLAKGCVTFLNFFCHKIMTIRHQLDTLSITDAPAFPWIDEAIISCELSKFSPTSEDELSGLLKKIAAKLCSLDPVPSFLLRYCIYDLLPKPFIQFSFNAKFHEECSVVSSAEETVLRLRTLF